MAPVHRRKKKEEECIAFIDFIILFESRKFYKDIQRANSSNKL
jgi:hypothetical protein